MKIGHCFVYKLAGHYLLLQQGGLVLKLDFKIKIGHRFVYKLAGDYLLLQQGGLVLKLDFKIKSVIVLFTNSLVIICFYSRVDWYLNLFLKWKSAIVLFTNSLAIICFYSRVDWYLNFFVKWTRPHNYDLHILVYKRAFQRTRLLPNLPNYGVSTKTSLKRSRRFAPLLRPPYLGLQTCFPNASSTKSAELRG